MALSRSHCSGRHPSTGASCSLDHAEGGREHVDEEDRARRSRSASQRRQESFAVGVEPAQSTLHTGFQRLPSALPPGQSGLLAF